MPSVSSSHHIPWPWPPFRRLLWYLEARVPHLQRSTDSLFHDDVQRLGRTRNDRSEGRVTGLRMDDLRIY